jgi:hypothetical protein
LKANVPLVVNYIMAVAAIPRKWGRVKTIIPDPQGVTLHSTQGRAVHVPLDFNFLHS